MCLFLESILHYIVEFQAAWNQHALSSENNLSPLQLYTAYAQNSELFDEVIDPDCQDTYSDSNSGDEDNYESSVIVPLTHIPLSSNSLQQLRNAINVNEECSDFGKQLYINTVHLVYTLMQNDNLID